MDSSFSPKDEIWFLCVCHHISNAVYFPRFRSVVLSSSTAKEFQEEYRSDLFRCTYEGNNILRDFDKFSATAQCRHLRRLLRSSLPKDEFYFRVKKKYIHDEIFVYFYLYFDPLSSSFLSACSSNFPHPYPLFLCALCRISALIIMKRTLVRFSKIL
jgi:hypothetical protein